MAKHSILGWWEFLGARIIPNNMPLNYTIDNRIDYVSGIYLCFCFGSFVFLRVIHLVHFGVSLEYIYVFVFIWCWLHINNRPNGTSYIFHASSLNSSGCKFYSQIFMNGLWRVRLFFLRIFTKQMYTFNSKPTHFRWKSIFSQLNVYFLWLAKHFYDLFFSNSFLPCFSQDFFHERAKKRSLFFWFVYFCKSIAFTQGILTIKLLYENKFTEFQLIHRPTDFFLFKAIAFIPIKMFH